VITKEQAVQLVENKILEQYADPDYKVYNIDTYCWGWIMDWMPPHKLGKTLYGSSNFMVHQNGFISTWNDVAWHERQSLYDQKGIIPRFVELATMN